MTLKELAEKKNLKITANDILYFDTYEASKDFQYEAGQSGIVIEIHQHSDRGRTVCAIKEVSKEPETNKNDRCK